MDYEVKIYIDVFGRVSICERCPNTIEYSGFMDLLEDCVESLEERYTEYTPGFYSGWFSYDYDVDLGPWFSLEKIESLRGE